MQYKKHDDPWNSPGKTAADTSPLNSGKNSKREAASLARWFAAHEEQLRWSLALGLVALLVAASLAGVPRLQEEFSQVAEEQAEAAIPRPPETDAAPPLADGSGSSIPIEDTAHDPTVSAISTAVRDTDPGGTMPPSHGTNAGTADAEDVFVIQIDRPIPEAALSMAYGYGYHPTTDDYRFHRGCDLLAGMGDPVFASAPGTVKEALESEYWGGYVSISHPHGWGTVCRGLKPVVAAGDTVQAGQLIGYVTFAPGEGASDPHIHFELEYEGESRDPALYW